MFKFLRVTRDLTAPSQKLRIQDFIIPTIILKGKMLSQLPLKIRGKTNNVPSYANGVECERVQSSLLKLQEYWHSKSTFTTNRLKMSRFREVIHGWRVTSLSASLWFHQISKIEFVYSYKWQLFLKDRWRVKFVAKLQ